MKINNQTTSIFSVSSLINTYLVLFLALSFFSSYVFGDNVLEKTKTAGKTNLNYEFTDYKGKIHKVALQINTAYINNSYNKIPKLKQLNDMFYNKIPKYANAIMAPYIKLANDEFAFFHKNINSSIANELGAIGDYFFINIKCPAKLFTHSTFTKNKQITYTLNTGTCQTFVKTDVAYKRLVNNLQQIANETNEKMNDGSYIDIVTSNKGYSIKFSVSDKYNKLMKDTQSLIVGYKEEYDNDVLYSTSISKELTSNYKNVIADIALELNQDIYSLSDKLQEDKQALLNKFYLKLQKQNDEKSQVYIDYKKLINEYDNSILKFSYNGANNRDRLNFYLNFLQSIPYDVLTKRSIKGYAGFLPPLALLDANKGDCDSKSVAFLSFIKQFSKDIRSVLILTPNHAFVGVAIEAKAGDSTYTYDGIKYVLAEVAGPSVVELGIISKDTKYAIDSGNIEYMLKF
jgi:hypothetical protein